MADDNARHDDPTPELHLPDARPGCWRVTRSAGLRWLACLIGINLVCFFVAMDVHGRRLRRL